MALVEITSCDCCPEGCVDHDCYQCYSPLRPENLRRLAKNLATAAALLRSFELGRAAWWAWTPGCGEGAPW